MKFGISKLAFFDPRHQLPAVTAEFVFCGVHFVSVYPESEKEAEEINNALKHLQPWHWRLWWWMASR
ncbi:MAG: hypothetical protein M3463_22990 [Verrucomicrobiota bacterium]|nr:hypothetical protein [Verrucomicrobiota bacterium]